MNRCVIVFVAILFLAGCAPRQQTDYYEGKHLRYWVNLAQSDDPVKRKAAVVALGKIGPHGVPTLLLLRQDKDHRVETAAMLALVEIGPGVGPELVELLQDPDPLVRLNAVKAAAFLGRNATSDAVPVIASLAANDSNKAVRQAAADAMKVLKHKGKPVLRPEETPP